MHASETEEADIRRAKRMRNTEGVSNLLIKRQSRAAAPQGADACIRNRGSRHPASEANEKHRRCFESADKKAEPGGCTAGSGCMHPKPRKQTSGERSE